MEKMTLEQFMELNASTQSYRNFSRFKPDAEEETWLKDETAREYAKRDLQLFEDRIIKFEASDSPKAGEWIKGYNGNLTRFTYAWKDGIQTGGGMTSFYLTEGGTASYSGGLDSSVPFDMIELTENRIPAQFWIFHQGWSGAHRGVNYLHPCREWRVKPLSDISQIHRLPYQYRVAEVTEQAYNDALNVVPPLAWNLNAGFFAMGEAYSHQTVVPSYYCFIRLGGKYYCTISILDTAMDKFMEFAKK